MTAERFAKLSLAVLLLAALPAAAEKIINVPIANASFEQNGLGRGGSWSFTIDGWVKQGQCGSFKLVPQGFAAYPAGTVQALDGVSVAFCNGQGAIGQQLSLPIEAGITYTLMVDLGNRLDNPFPGYAVQLLADGEPIARTDEPTPADGTFATATVTYRASADDPTLGKKLGIGLIGNGTQINFDNVRLIASWSTPREQVEEYVETRYDEWARRGKFEKSEDYEARVNEETIAAKREALISEGAARVAAETVRWKTAGNRYDPEREVFIIAVEGLEPFELPVPLDEAEAVDKYFSKLQYLDPVYTIGPGDDLVLHSAEVTVPRTGKTYVVGAAD